MKTIRVLFIGTFLIIAGATFQQAIAQEKTKEQKEQELRTQKAIEEQKKVFADQKRAQEEALKAIQEQTENLDDVMKDVRVRVEAADRYRDASRMGIPRGDRSFFGNDQFIFTPGGDSWSVFSIGDSERTTWDFSRSVKENTFSKEYTFEVDKTAKSVVMSVMGDCKAGEIRIKILMPNGKSYSDIVIDEFGNLNWRKSFTISETENQDKTGTWKFKVDSKQATGYFKISLQSN
jgi:type II secretory pathway pseudopilin PulG